MIINSLSETERLSEISKCRTQQESRIQRQYLCEAKQLKRVSVVQYCRHLALDDFDNFKVGFYLSILFFIFVASSDYDSYKLSEKDRWTKTWIQTWLCICVSCMSYSHVKRAHFCFSPDRKKFLGLHDLSYLFRYIGCIMWA